jgi:hypothetical protein
MATSDLQPAFSTNGHIHPTHDQDIPHPCDVDHEDTTGSRLVDPTDRPEQEQDTPEIGLEVAGTAQPEEITPSPVLDNPPAEKSALSSKYKLTASPTKRPTPTVQTNTTKGASGPPTPQVKKVFTYFFAALRLFPTLF